MCWKSKPSLLVHPSIPNLYLHPHPLQNHIQLWRRRRRPAGRHVCTCAGHQHPHCRRDLPASRCLQNIPGHNDPQAHLCCGAMAPGRRSCTCRAASPTSSATHGRAAAATTRMVGGGCVMQANWLTAATQTQRGAGLCVWSMWLLKGFTIHKRPYACVPALRPKGCSFHWILPSI